MLLETLNERMRHWSSQQKIGDVFLYIIDFLKVYTEYVNNFDKANDTLQQSLKNNPRLENFLKVSLSFFQR
jgi:pantoate kinase